jgi:hypothetical protein
MSFVSLSAIPISIALNYVLIQWTQSVANNGGIGAAIATGLTETYIMCAALWLLPKGMLRGFRMVFLAKAVFSGACMVGVMMAVGMVGIHWVACAAIGSMVYVGCLFLLKTFQRGELAANPCRSATLF